MIRSILLFLHALSACVSKHIPNRAKANLKNYAHKQDMCLDGSRSKRELLEKAVTIDSNLQQYIQHVVALQNHSQVHAEKIKEMYSFVDTELQKAEKFLKDVYAARYESHEIFDRLHRTMYLARHVCDNEITIIDNE